MLKNMLRIVTVCYGDACAFAMEFVFVLTWWEFRSTCREIKTTDDVTDRSKRRTYSCLPLDQHAAKDEDRFTGKLFRMHSV